MQREDPVVHLGVIDYHPAHLVVRREQPQPKPQGQKSADQE